jgi:hypothetical protein
MNESKSNSTCDICLVTQQSQDDIFIGEVAILSFSHLCENYTSRNRNYFQTLYEHSRLPEISLLRFGIRRIWPRGIILCVPPFMLY